MIAIPERRALLAAGILLACLTSTYASDDEPLGAGPPLPYRPFGRPTEVQRSEAENRLAKDTANFRSVVFGGFLSSMMTRGPMAIAACYTRYPNLRAQRDQCLSAATVAIMIAGVSQGYAAAKLQESGQNRVRAMQAVTEDMARDNARLQETIDASELVLNESQARLKKLRDDVQAKRVAADQAKLDSRREQENLKTLTQALNDARSTRDEYQKTAASFQGTPAEKRNLDAEIATMSAKVRALESNVKKLTAALVPFTA